MSELGAYLKSKGFVVDDSPIRSRPGTFDVRAIMIHHYAGNEAASSAAGQAAYVKRDQNGVPAPLCNLYLDVTGKVWIISTKAEAGQDDCGRANHAGAGIWPDNGSVLPRDQGNSYSVGIEIQNDGTHPISGALYQKAIDLSAALCRRYGLPASRVVGHKEYAKVQGKVDPRNNMDQWRKDTNAALSKTGSPIVAISEQDAKTIAKAVWNYALSTGWKADGTYDGKNPNTQKAAYFLLATFGATAKTASTTGALTLSDLPSDDDEVSPFAIFDLDESSLKPDDEPEA